jgi:hypothetical protein
MRRCGVSNEKEKSVNPWRERAKCVCEQFVQETKNIKEAGKSWQSPVHGVYSSGVHSGFQAMERHGVSIQHPETNHKIPLDPSDWSSMR